MNNSYSSNGDSGGHVFQVIGNYEIVDTGKNDYLVASKGDIIVDCERVDDNWFRGKNIRSGTYGLIPKANVVSLQQHEYSELEPELVEKLNEEGVNTSSSNSDVRGQTSQSTTLDDTEDPDIDDCKTSLLTKLGESKYVDMSSEETLNCIDEKTTPQKEETAKVGPKKTPIPKPPRHPSVSESSKAAYDEGYNSASHYSGENTDSNAPLLNDAKVSIKQDEAGYEVPNLGTLKSEEAEGTGTKQRQKKKKKSLMMLWKGKDTQSQVVNEKPPADEARENYYDPPPADIRDNYFLPYTSKPTFRVVLSFIAALGISVTLFLVLLLLGKLHGVLSFSLSLIVFIVLFVVPVTLYHRGILCVTLLLFPSFFGHRSKVAIIVLLIVFIILGPVFGTADKISMTRSCAVNGDVWFNKNDTRSELTNIQKNCVSNFKIIADYCKNNIYPRFKSNCENPRKTKEPGDEVLCEKPLSYFCWNVSSLEAHCSITTPSNESTYNVPDADAKELQVTKTFKQVIFFLFPLLGLLILAEAYTYNKVYVTTKNTDNIYITQRLRELDTERRNRGLTDLILPLTRIELYTYLLRGKWSVTKAERTNVTKWIGFLVVVVFLAVTLILVENAVHGILLVTQTEQCLEYYKDWSRINYRNVIYSLLGTLLFIIIAQSHCLRLRSVVCDYMYPEMVETRSKHLYYKILHDRHAFARHVRRKIQLLSEEKRLRLRISFFSKLYAVLPSRLQCFCDLFIVRTCMICDSLSYHKTIECLESTCRAHYCFECHVDAGQNCLTCKSPAPQTNTSAAPRSSFCV